MQIGGMYTIDFARVSKIPKFEVTIKNGDSKRTIKLILLKNSEVLNLNNYTIVVAAKKIDDKDIFNDVKTIDAESGICEVEITEQMLALDMDLPCEIVLYNADGVVASSSNFVISKINSIKEDTNIVSSDEFKALTKALSDVTWVKSGLNSKRDKSTKLTKEDLDMSSDSKKIGLNNLADEVHRAMSGNAQVNPIIPNGSITNEKYANKSISPDKLDMGGAQHILRMTTYAGEKRIPIEYTGISDNSLNLFIKGTLYIGLNNNKEFLISQENGNATIIDGFYNDNGSYEVNIPHNGCLVADYSTSAPTIKLVDNFTQVTKNMLLLARAYRGDLQGGCCHDIFSQRAISQRFMDCVGYSYTSQNPILLTTPSNPTYHTLTIESNGYIWILGYNGVEYYNYWSIFNPTTNLNFSFGEFDEITGKFKFELEHNEIAYIDTTDNTVKKSNYLHIGANKILLARNSFGRLTHGVFSDMLEQTTRSYIDSMSPLDWKGSRPKTGFLKSESYANANKLDPITFTSLTDGVLTLTLKDRFYICLNNGSETALDPRAIDYTDSRIIQNPFVGIYNYDDDTYTVDLKSNQSLVYNIVTNNVELINHYLQIKPFHVLLLRCWESKPAGGILHQAYNDIKLDHINSNIDNYNTIRDNIALKFSSNKNVMVAHRGLSQLAPENTLPAYELAGKYGFWGAECDIYEAADGHFVLMHDSTLDRTTNGTGNIEDFTLAQIKELTIDEGANIYKYPNLKVPTLEEFLLVCKKWSLTPVIEIKSMNTSSAKKFLDIINKWGFEHQAVVISFSKPVMEVLRQESKNIILQPLLDLTIENIDYCYNLGKNTMMDSYYENITKENIEYAHSKGILVNCWTVDNASKKDELFRLGIDMITTNIVIHNHNINNYVSERSMIKGEDKYKSYIHSSLSKTTNEVLQARQYKYLSDIDGLRINDDLTSKGAIVIPLNDIELGDIIVATADFKYISGEAPKIAVDYVYDGGFQQQLYTQAQPKTDEWQTITLECIVKRENDPSINSRYDVLFGTWTTDAGEFEVKNIKMIKKLI